MGGILWDVITLGSGISETIYLILRKFTGCTLQVLETLNTDFQSILKYFPNVVISTV